MTLFDIDSFGREDGMIPVARISELVPGQLKRIIVNGQPILLVLRKIIVDNTAYEVAAFGSICPHAMGDLSQGWLTDDEIDCPVHYYRFNVISGECTSPKGGPRLRCYPVKVEGNQVWLKISAPRWMEQAE